MAETESNKPVEPVHSAFFTVIQPNVLIGIKGKADFRITEMRVYNEILGYDHVTEKNRLRYDIPVSLVTKNKNYKVIAEDIKESLLSRTFVLNKETIQYTNKHVSKEKHSDADHLIIHPFHVGLSEKKNTFEVHLDERFKIILWSVEEAKNKKLNNDTSKIGYYSRGDNDTLRELNHTASNLMYWEIRTRQPFRNTWKTTFDQMREDLGYGEKYEDNYKEFRRKVLEPAKEELANTWCAFDYEALPGSTKGRKFTNINVFFKYGPEDEKNSPYGKDVINYPWEPKMLKYGIENSFLKVIRDNINSGKEGIDKDKNVFKWTYDYVETSLKYAREQYRIQDKAPDSKVRTIVGFLIKGLEQGWWNRQVEQELSTLKKAVQTALFDQQ